MPRWETIWQQFLNSGIDLILFITLHAVLQGHEPVVHQGAGAAGGVLQTLRGGAGWALQEVSQRISWAEITLQKKV